MSDERASLPKPSLPQAGEIVVSNNCDTCKDHEKEKLESFRGPVHVDITQPDMIVIRKRVPGNPHKPGEDGPVYHFVRKTKK